MTNGEVTRGRSVAPLKNVAALMTLVKTLQKRPAGLPGIGVGSGPSGFGKSVAAQFCQNKLGCLYIEARSYWTAKAFCENLLIELSGRPKGTITQMMGQIIDLMGDQPDRPLIVDEADKLVDKRQIELIRDIYETTQVPVILVGEEELPTKLAEFERVHNRVLDWVLFQPCDLDDTRALADLVLRGEVTIADDLIEAIRQQTGGRARRIATTLHEVAQFARTSGKHELDVASYRGRIFKGESPRRLAGVA